MKKLVYLCLFSVLLGCSPKLFKEKWTEIQAPETFTARFETTQGNFDIEAKRAWSPKGVDRLYQLISKNYYTDIAIFRVVPNFVAQFGIHNNTFINKSWGDQSIADEPVLEKNEKMTIAFARGGANSRSNQIFINLEDNFRLDNLDYGGAKGFPVVAKVISGQENILKFYSGYAEKPAKKQGQIAKFGNTYVKENFPKIDFITKAYILKK
ncbi:peptidylprolyl isomerase [uncultured Polaribacter sp.]|uniref:peptidylprolyl isomerase n=1 Tax=uncultured Polaribacter sp. TaxID=174711 RepID=UPI00263749B8|nr:peptidylprolyl isomerase [uncultured Polaribacter sp.]